jgi:hypothetical protein
LRSRAVSSRAEPPPFDWPVSLVEHHGACRACSVASIVSIAARTYNPFIYFRF